MKSSTYIKLLNEYNKKFPNYQMGIGQSFTESNGRVGGINPQDMNRLLQNSPGFENFRVGSSGGMQNIGGYQPGGDFASQGFSTGEEAMASMNQPKRSFQEVEEELMGFTNRKPKGFGAKNLSNSLFGMGGM